MAAVVFFHHAGFSAGTDPEIVRLSMEYRDRSALPQTRGPAAYAGSPIRRHGGEGTAAWCSGVQSDAGGDERGWRSTWARSAPIQLLSGPGYATCLPAFARKRPKRTGPPTDREPNAPGIQSVETPKAHAPFLCARSLAAPLSVPQTQSRYQNPARQQQESGSLVALGTSARATFLFPAPGARLLAGEHSLILVTVAVRNGAEQAVAIDVETG